MRMPQELKTKWIEALESGEYKQGKGTLCSAPDGAYCCLGVLERVAENDVEPYGFPSTAFYTRNGIEDGDRTESSLSGVVVAVASFLAERNDMGMSFPEIAKLIREKVEGY
jgi:hypothetical protein